MCTVGILQNVCEVLPESTSKRSRYKAFISEITYLKSSENVGARYWSATQRLIVNQKVKTLDFVQHRERFAPKFFFQVVH